ncbi:MAG: fasciclin [Flavobacteriales bacterium]|nr:fasciclin [Flavobacteriales bacterium]|tara:strand:+ start:1389 stop:1952 length:564 start_codon:yes stop_codon:yes gene_type:complete
MKKLVKLLFGLIVITAVSCTSTSQNSQDNSSEELQMDKTEGQAFVEDDVSNPNILQVASKSEDHSTLVAAVQAADLENALVNAGPLMVFAPVNAAFDALPDGTVESLLKEENKDQLANILKYHVTPGKYSKDFLKKFKKLGQANDQSVEVKVEGDDVYVGGAKIIASVEASNGIIHVVDKVIIPPSE